MKYIEYDNLCNLTENLTFISTDRTVHLVWLSTIMFIQMQFKPSGYKTCGVPSSPSEIYLFQTPLSFGISMALHGVGMDIFWNHTF